MSSQDKNDQPSPDSRRSQPPPQGLPPLVPVIVFAVLFFVVWWFFVPKNSLRSEISYSFFREQIRAAVVDQVRFEGGVVYGKFKAGKEPTDPEKLKEFEEKIAKNAKSGAAPIAGNDEERKKLPKVTQEFIVYLPVALMEDQSTPTLYQDLAEHKVTIVASEKSDALNTLSMFLMTMLPLVILVGLMIFMFRRMRDQVSGGGILGNFNRSPARRYEAEKEPITFADVAGLEGVKAELEEIVEFLKNPTKFQRLGGRIPKGTLLMGPPGTGKTLLAKAVAGEAGVPFYSINGSEFIQMFVGVGASRVRDLFRTAKDNAPCIVFIDEIDAVGRIRGAGFGGGHDEREQTLNQILSEMDGFAPTESVIVIAATNRPDVLDPALLRPGRFDRHVTVDRPTLKGRIQQFQVHTRKVPLADDVDIDKLAKGTVGLTGADIRNLVNEAALWATRMGKDRVDMSDFEFARDKVLMGPKREEVLLGIEKEMTAYHESGHALLAWVVPGGDPVHKISIIPRGRALGVTQLLQEEDRLSIGEQRLYAMLCFILGGRAAEKLIYNEFSAGAENDLKKATSIARRMVTQWGMSERIGPVAYRTTDDQPFLGKEYHEERQYSEHTAQIIDEEIVRLLHGADQRAREILEKHRPDLDKLTQALLAEETLDEAKIEEILGPSVNRRLPKVEPKLTAKLENGKPADGEVQG